MRRLVRAEARKLTTTWLAPGYLVAAVGLGVLVVLPLAFTGSGQLPAALDIGSAEVQRRLLAQGSTALLLGALLGTVAGARGFGHGTAARTFLVAPRRSRAVGAKLAVLLPTGILVGAALQAAVVVAAAAVLPFAGESLQVPVGEGGRLVAVAGLGAAVAVVIGLAVGLVARRTGPAVVGMVLVLVVVEPLVSNGVRGVAPWLPTVLVDGLATRGAVVEPVSPVAAVAALAGWALVPLAAALATLLRRDVA